MNWIRDDAVAYSTVCAPQLNRLSQYPLIQISANPVFTNVNRRLLTSVDTLPKILPKNGFCMAEITET